MPGAGDAGAFRGYGGPIPPGGNVMDMNAR